MKKTEEQTFGTHDIDIGTIKKRRGRKPKALMQQTPSAILRRDTDRVFDTKRIMEENRFLRRTLTELLSYGS